MIGLTIITQLVYWYRDLKTPGSDETELREIVKVERKEKIVPKSRALATIQFPTPYEQPWTDREDFGLNAYDNMQDIQERQNDVELRFSDRLAANSNYSDVRKCNSKDIGSGFKESLESNSNYSAVRNPKPTECQSYYNGPSYSGQSYCSGSSYSGQSYCSGPSYSGQSYCSGPSYSGQSYCSGHSYSGQSVWSRSESFMENPDRMEWDSFDSGIRYSDRPEWIGSGLSYSDHAGISGPVSSYSDHAGISGPLTHYSDHAGISGPVTHYSDHAGIDGPVQSYSDPSNAKDKNSDDRRRRWERNEIDYMGQDSFENILAKLQSSLN